MSAPESPQNESTGRLLRADTASTAPDGVEVTYHELHARLLLAQSLISHRLDTHNPDVAAVLAVLRGDLSLAGVE